MSDPSSSNIETIFVKSTVVAPAFSISQVCYTFINACAHWLIGAVTTISLFFAFKDGLPLDATSLHIVLCVIGYQLLVAEAILVHSPHNGWTAPLKLNQRRRVHWILQIGGSGLAVTGCVIKIVDTEYNWDTLHGQLGFIAMLFTLTCFFNGFTSMYPNKIKCISPRISKLTHICFGASAYGTSTIALCYGFDLEIFRNWLGVDLTTGVIIVTAVLAGIIVINPIIDIYYKIKNQERYY